MSRHSCYGHNWLNSFIGLKSQQCLHMYLIPMAACRKSRPVWSYEETCNFLPIRTTRTIRSELLQHQARSLDGLDLKATAKKIDVSQVVDGTRTLQIVMISSSIAKADTRHQDVATGLALYCLSSDSICMDL